MVSQTVKTNFEQIIDESRDQRAEVRNLIQKGKWREAEPDEKRKAAFMIRERLHQKQNGKESQIGTLDWLDISYFTEGSTIEKAVGYIAVLTDQTDTTGTGFMVSPGLLMTNNHVIPDEASARNATVTFNKENDELGKPRATTKFRLNPDAFFLTSNEDDLDYTIVAIGNREFGEWNASELGFFILSDAPDKHVIGMSVNIIQHPLDLPKKVSFRNNSLTYRTDNALLYEADTETCSSGSPVCNDFWDLVAIHHWGEPYKAKKDNPDSDLPNYVNEGIRISAIYEDLSKRLESLSGTKKELLLQVLSYAKTLPAVTPKVPTSRPPATTSSPEHGESNTSVKPMVNNKIVNQNPTVMSTNREIKFTIPIEISIRIGDNDITTLQAPPAKQTAKDPTLFAEASKMDADYSNRSGYDPDFIPGFSIPLPDIKNKGDIAPLKHTEENYKDGVLIYEHFVVILNQKRRCAFYTATNIDGETYKSVNRKTGEVLSRSEMNADEGETWYPDDRIDEKYHLNQAFFSDWSHLFDRGHLTRRSDPSWGSKTVAVRADTDTFHFANCSIQHFRFNETIPYWQGAERYILETGLLKAGVDSRLIVFQGPVYNDAVDKWADDYQIPSQFFKIALWKNAKDDLKAVGLMVDQSKLLNEERKSLGEPRTVDQVNVSQWRVSIANIEKLTGLDFGEEVRGADTIKLGDQPNVGGPEALVKIPLRSWEDLLK